MKVMKTNLSLKVLSLLLAGMMTFGLASCEDDEMETDNETEVNTTLPTEDEVKTTVGKSYAVIGSNFDEVTPYVLKRMTGQRYDYSLSDTYLPDDVEVVFLDTESLVKVNELMAYEIKDVFDRGGSVYLHKPNALAIAFFQMFMDNELDDFMDWTEENTGSGGKGAGTRTDQDGDPLTRDSYVMNRNGSLDMADIYNGKEVMREATVTEVGEDGKEQTKTVTESFTPAEPTAYEYGLFAEQVAAWINDKPVTRASDGTELKMPYARRVLVPCHIQRKGDNKQITASAIITVRAASFYSPQENEDFYYVTTEQWLPMGAFAKQNYYYKKNPKDSEIYRARGYSWYNAYAYLPVVESEEHRVTSGTPQPMAKGAVPATVSVDGWAAGSTVYQDDGTVALLTNPFRPEILALPPEDRLKFFKFEPSDDYGDNYWYYGTGERDCYYNNTFLDASHPNNQNILTRQSFIYKVDNTAKRGGKAFEMKIRNKFSLSVAWSEHSGMRWESESLEYRMHYPIYDGTVTITLPVPNRYSEKYTIAPDRKYSDWNDLEANLKSYWQYKNLVENQYCSSSESALAWEMSNKWSEAKEALNRYTPFDLSKVKNEYIIRMTNAKGEEVGTPLYITPYGVNLFEHGSYYMSDGSFLPAKTKLTEEQKKNCIGIVCSTNKTSDNQFPKGINGFAVALHDASPTPCTWGDVTPFAPKDSDFGWLLLYDGAGYDNTHVRMMEAARRDGKEPSKEWYPTLYYALNYPVANPKANKGWFLPSRNDLTMARGVALTDEAFERAGGEPLERNRVYATSTLSRKYKELGNFEYEEYNMILTAVLRGEGKHWSYEYFNPEEEVFYVRPFIAF